MICTATLVKIQKLLCLVFSPSGQQSAITIIKDKGTELKVDLIQTRLSNVHHHHDHNIIIQIINNNRIAGSGPTITKIKAKAGNPTILFEFSDGVVLGGVNSIRKNKTITFPVQPDGNHACMDKVL